MLLVCPPYKIKKDHFGRVVREYFYMVLQEKQLFLLQVKPGYSPNCNEKFAFFEEKF